MEMGFRETQMKISKPASPKLKLARCPHSLSRRGDLYLDHSHCPVLAPATLAALPSTRATPDRGVFYACHDVASAKVGRFSRPLHSPKLLQI